MRKIREDEVGKIARLFTRIFAEYDAYRLFFPDEKKLARGMEAFFRYEVYASQEYTWVDEDFLAAAAVKCPGDRDRDPKRIFYNPFAAISFLTDTGVRAMKLAGEYLRFAEEISARYYDPRRDAYIKNVGVAPEARGQGRLRRITDELCGDLPVYLETHDENNVRKQRRHLRAYGLQSVRSRRFPRLHPLRNVPRMSRPPRGTGGAAP